MKKFVLYSLSLLFSTIAFAAEQVVLENPTIADYKTTPPKGLSFKIKSMGNAKAIFVDCQSDRREGPQLVNTTFQVVESERKIENEVFEALIKKSDTADFYCWKMIRLKKLLNERKIKSLAIEIDEKTKLYKDLNLVLTDGSIEKFKDGFDLSRTLALEKRKENHPPAPEPAREPQPSSP